MVSRQGRLKYDPAIRQRWGVWFRDWLEKSGHTAAKVATYTAIDQATISDWWHGRKRASPDLILKLCAWKFGPLITEALQAAGYPVPAMADAAITQRRHPDMEEVLETLDWDAQAAIAEAIRHLTRIRHEIEPREG